MERAVNPNTGEVVFLVNNQWVKPAQTARNPKTGEMAYLVGGAWQVVKPIPMGEVEGAAPISPEELLTPPTETPEEIALKEKTKKYEAGTTMGERAKRDLERGVIALQKMPAELQVSSIQKEIERIRSGQAGRTDTMTGEFIPMSPEEEEAALAALQARQAEALREVQKRQAEMQAIPGRPVTEAISEAKTFGEAMKALSTDPLGAMAGFSLESLPQMAPALVAGAVTRRPEIAALGMGGTSFTSELSNSVFEYLQDNGIDINDSNAVLKALDDPKIFKEAYDFALKRGAIIGTLDAASAGLASKALVPKKLIGSPKAREAVNIAIAQPASQVISGAGGEAAAQLATYGEVKKPGAVVGEAIAGGPTSLAETAAFGGRRIYEEFRSKEAEAPEVEAAKPPVKKAAERIEPTIEPEVKEEAPKEVKPAFAAEEIEDAETPALKLPEAPAVVADQVEMKRLEDELAKVQARQMDPMLPLDDPRLGELQSQESEIKARLAELRGEIPVTEDLYDRLIKATPQELKKINIPKAEAPELYIRASDDKNASEELIKKLTKVVNKMEPKEFPKPKVAVETPKEEPIKAGKITPPPSAEVIMENFGVGRSPAQKYLDVYSKFYDIYNRFHAGEDIAQEYTDILLEKNKAYQRLTNISRQNKKRAAAKAPEVPAVEPAPVEAKPAKDVEPKQEMSAAEKVKVAEELLDGLRFGESIDSENQRGIQEILGISRGFDAPVARRLMAIAKVPKAIQDKVMSQRPVTIDDLSEFIAPLVAEKTARANDEKLFAQAKDVANTNEEIRNALNIYDSYKNMMDAIATERGKYGVKWAERNVSARWVEQSQKAKKAKQRVIDLMRKQPVKKPAEKKAEIKEEKAKANQLRQEVQKEIAKNYERDLEIGPGAGEIIGDIKTINKFKVYKVKYGSETQYRVQTPFNRAMNRIGKDDTWHSDLGNAKAQAQGTDQLTPEEFIRDKKYYAERDAREAAPEVEEEVTPVTPEVEVKTEPATEAKKEEHVEAGESEPITKPVIQEAVTKGADKKDIDYTAMRREVERQVDEAIAKSPYETEKDWDATYSSRQNFVTFSIPGDGKFKIKNNKERLEEFKKKLMSSVKPKAAKGPQLAIAPADVNTTLRDLVDSNDIQSAIEFAALKGVKISESKLDLKQKLKVKEYMEDPDAFEKKAAAEAELTEAQRQAMARAEEERRIATNKRLAEEQEKRDKDRINRYYEDIQIGSDRTFKNIIRTLDKEDANKILDMLDSKDEAFPEGRLEEVQKKAGTYIDSRWKDFANKISSPVEAARVRKKLFEKFSTKEGEISLHKLVEKEVDSGSTIFTMESGERRLGDAAGYLSEKKIGTVGMDYAGFLIAQKGKRKKQEVQENVAETRRIVSKLKSNIDVDRDEVMQAYSNVRSKGRRAIKEVAKYGSDIPMQRELNKLLGYEQELKDYLDATAPLRNSAKDFLAKATKELADENISDDVFNFISEVYRKQPNLLEGLRLSVRSRKEPGRSTGNFAPLERIITLWKDGIGIEDPKTIRHEMTHTLEQMMPPSAQKAIAEAWTKAFERAMKKNIDTPSQSYFEAVLLYLDDPTEKSYAKAISLMPDYSFYQYINPSEFWAVNAENLMGAQMGSGWDRFKKTVRKLFEMLKSFFGFDNNYVVHREFDKVINGKQVRITKRTIAQLVQNTGYDPTFLENVDDVDKLLEKHNRPDAPLHSSGSVKDRLMNTYNGTKKIGTRIVEDGLFSVGKGVISGMDRAITNLRNKFVWYGSGLDQADFSRYNGQLRDSQERAVASIAVTNAIHAGHVGTQVMVQGGLEFNPESQQFMAVKRSKSMANVLKEKAKLVNQLGAQRAANVIQAYFEAKRSRSIINEYLEREDKYQKALDSGVDVEQAQKDLDNIERAASKVQMDDEQIDEFIALEEEYPELRAMMDNWTAVNQNMLDVLYFAGNLSKARYQALKAIKDYVPWYRIMEDQTDPHDFPTGGTTKTMTNVAREKMFKPGEVGLDIDDIVDNMIHNVMWMTKNAMRNYAANRVADEYGIRNEKGKLKVFPKEGTDSQGVKFNILRNGRRIVVGVADPLIAESVIGMENVEIPMNRILSIMANGLRRSITLSGAFQIKQLFMDAPTAAWVSGVKNPFAVWANTFISFGKVLIGTDPIAQKLRQAGIGGFQSTARTPEKELALEIGLLNKSMYARVLKVLDQIGDASDYAQRVAVYKQVLKETGDEAQALLQANNVIDFLKRGSGQTAQYLGRTVAFMNAYAQSVDVLATALAGGGLKGMDRKKAVTRMAITGTLLSFTTLLYCFAIGDDEEYEKMDDSTKLRNFVIPGTKQLFGETVALPMHTSASFIFKAIPELLYNTYLREGAKDEMDSRRFRKALKEAFMDSMLGPNVVPTGVKPFVELGLNRNFWTGTTVIPKGMEDLTAAEQYNAATSELGKVVSALTSVPGTEDKRLLSPIEADHLMRGLFGSAAAMAMWSTNLLAGDRPEGRVRDIPVIGSFVLPPVPRGREDLFYDLKDATDEKMKTYKKLLDREKFEEAEEYFDKNEGILGLYKYTNKVDNTLKKINKEIQRIGTASSDTLSPAERRERMDELGELKNDILEGIAERRTDVFDLADPLFLRKD